MIKLFLVSLILTALSSVSMAAKLITCENLAGQPVVRLVLHGAEIHAGSLGNGNYTALVEFSYQNTLRTAKIENLFRLSDGPPKLIQLGNLRGPVALTLTLPVDRRRNYGTISIGDGRPLIQEQRVSCVRHYIR